MIGPITMHYLTLTGLVVFPVFATALGQARIGKAAIAALNEQPGNAAGIRKVFFTGIALSETIALIAILMAAYLATAPLTTLLQVYARLGCFLALVLPATLLSYLGSISIAQALKSAARQPFLTTQLMSFMLITQSLMQTPAIFCAIFALIIESKAVALTDSAQALQLFSAGLLLALCSIGPCIGLTSFMSNACAALKINRQAYGSLFSFTFMSQAIIETPFLLGLATTIVMLQLTPTTLLKGIQLLAAAIALGGATIPVSIASAHACTQVLQGIAHRPATAPLLGRISLFCQAFIDTTAIYGLIIAFVLILM